MSTIAITIKGVHKLQRRVANCRQRILKKKAAFGKAVIIIDRWVQKNFASEGKAVGGWEPLAESTKARRRVGKKKAKGHRILQDTGQLKTRWKHRWTDIGAQITSGVPYAVYHDSDKPRPRKKLPRRQILPDEKHISKDLEKIFNRHIAMSIKREDLD